MSLIDELRARLKKEPKKVDSVDYLEFGITDTPRIVEKKGHDWVFYGEDNLYPLKISDFKHGSAIHNSILKTASKMIAGDGFLINGAKTPEESLLKYNSLEPAVRSAYDLFLSNKYNKLNIEKIKRKLAGDLKEYGAYCYEVILNNEKNKIATVKYVDVKNIRAGKMENDEVKSYWYCRDWSEWRKNKPKEIKAFDVNNKDLNQLVYEKIGNLEYYGEPDYSGALTWIQVDFQMGIFHLSNLENGMNPSIKLQFYKVPSTETDKQNILNDIKRAWVGPKNTAKHMVFFSDGKELAPDVSPITPSGLDKQLVLLAELCDKKILTGHQLTSPLLAGVSISGQLGGNVELEKAFKIYDKVVIAYYRNMIAESFQKILEFNKIPVNIEINPFNPFV
jgi:hypothetical protein